MTAPAVAPRESAAPAVGNHFDFETDVVVVGGGGGGLPVALFKGVDEDFQRGERPVQLMFNGPPGESSGTGHPTMHPISARGPFYAALVVGATLDTKGGPRTDTEGRVLDDAGRPVPGLFGVGKCVASASGNASWAGGATLGPIIAFAHRAASAVAARPFRDLTAAAALPVA